MSSLHEHFQLTLQYINKLNNILNEFLNIFIDSLNVAPNFDAFIITIKQI